MDTVALALKMKRLQPWMDEACGFGERRLSFDGPPHGQAYLSISRATQDVEPSGNFNRINLCGSEEGLTRAGLADLFEVFRAEGIANFSVWLSPGPRMDEIRSWLSDAGFALGQWTRYPVMQLTAESAPPLRTDLDIREVGPDEVARAKPALGETMWDGYLISAGKPGFHHFMAFDGARPVAVAALALFEDLAYLGWMSTAESDRRRGAQQALIAARIAKANELGAGLIVAETLTMLESSLGNLERAGFREVYEKEVYRQPET
jgi:GNAT superfamily N-acetyltransferase